MNQKLLLILVLFIAGNLFGQNTNPFYNKQLADSLGADEYGMRMYQFVILKTGDSVITNKEKVNQLFRGHMENIGRLAKANKLIIAGPFGKNDYQYRGLYIFTTKTKTETEALLETDPAIKAGLLKAVIFDWYGSAALPLYLPVHDAIEKNKP